MLFIELGSTVSMDSIILYIEACRRLRKLKIWRFIMSQVIDAMLQVLGDHMTKAEESMVHDFNAVRTGKASPALIENVMVDYYGTPTRLRDLANITAPEARLLVVQPWDASVVKLAEKAIINANIGLNPVNDGKLLRIPVPELSVERRQQFVKQVKARAEEAKVAVRNQRRDANEAIKKAQKSSEITEDELKGGLESIQKATDKHIENIDKILGAKEKELSSI